MSRKSATASTPSPDSGFGDDPKVIAGPFTGPLPDDITSGYFMRYRNSYDHGFDANTNVRGRDLELDVAHVFDGEAATYPGDSVGVRMTYDAAQRLISILSDALDEIDRNDEVVALFT